MSLTADSLADAMENSNGVDYAALFPAVNQCLLECDCTTVERAAMWFGQVGEESGGLRWMEEIASGAEYEGRSDLGNTSPATAGDSKGRGPIQVTGRHNYTQLSQWAFDNGLVPSPTFFVDDPEQLASDQYGFMGVTWYWTTQRPMNDAADARDIVRATKYVNGGTHGLDDRTHRWQHALAMGDAILPTRTARPSFNAQTSARSALSADRSPISGRAAGAPSSTCCSGTPSKATSTATTSSLSWNPKANGPTTTSSPRRIDTVWDLVDTDYASWSVLSANNRSINYVIGRSYAGGRGSSGLTTPATLFASWPT
jgi:predicted chitinase